MGSTALMYAVDNFNDDIVQMLIEAGADANIQDRVSRQTDESLI